MSRNKNNIREEMLLEAMGRLPEDLIGETRNPPPRKKKTVWKWSFCGAAGLAAATIIFVTLWSGREKEIFGWKDERSGQMVEQEQRGDSEKEKILESISILTYTEEKETSAQKKTSEDASTSSKAQGDVLDIEDAFGGKQERMERGKTMKLFNLRTENQEGDDIALVAFSFGDSKGESAYKLSVAGNGVFLSIDNLKNKAEEENKEIQCKAGEMVYIKVFPVSQKDEEIVQVPEWEEEKIETIATVQVTSWEEKEKVDFGLVSIGKRGETYYGIYQVQE